MFSLSGLAACWQSGTPHVCLPPRPDGNCVLCGTTRVPARPLTFSSPVVRAHHLKWSRQQHC